MSDLYHQLLEASIQHLQGLQARGVRFVSVSQQTLKALSEQSSLAPHEPQEPAVRQKKGLLSPALSSRVGEAEDTPGEVRGFKAPPQPVRPSARSEQLLSLDL